MKSVAVMSRKGGSGKTTLAHLLCLGAVWNDVPAFFFHTDDREPIKTSGRPYDYIDGRDVNTLVNYYNYLQTKTDTPGLIVIDSGGNRPKFDKWIGEHVDIVLIPVQIDSEDVSVALKHAEDLIKVGADVYYIVNRSPSRLSKYDEELMSRLPKNKVIGRLGEVRASRLLRDNDRSDGFITPTTPVNNASRSVYRIVKDYII